MSNDYNARKYWNGLFSIFSKILKIRDWWNKLVIIPKKIICNVFLKYFILKFYVHVKGFHKTSYVLAWSFATYYRIYIIIFHSCIESTIWIWQHEAWNVTCFFQHGTDPSIKFSGQRLRRGKFNFVFRHTTATSVKNVHK